MPHICTRCNSSFNSGEDILKGCPVCGWKKFMYMRRAPADREDNASEQLITRAMGVKSPPRRYAKENADKLEDKSTAAPAPQPQPTGKIKASLKPKTVGGSVDQEKLESIKIMAPGSYELNLPSLFEREELIMAVKDGTYFIDLSSAFKKGKKD